MEKFVLELSIENFILIDSHKFTIKKGLTSVTGETGAGKSIVFQAIKFLSGEKSGSQYIKKGKDYSEISATLSLIDFPQLSEVIDDLDLNVEDNEIFIRRKVTSQGRSSAFINNVKINISKLKEIGKLIFVIVGQHDAHLLSSPEYQISLIDSFGKYKNELKEVDLLYKEIKTTEKLLQESEKKQNDLSSEMQLLEYQIQELNKLEPKEDEYAELEKEYKILSNATELSAAYFSTADSLSGNKGAISQIKNALSEIGNFSDIQEASLIIDVLEAAKIELEEAANDASYLANKISFDQERYSYLNDRINTYYTLSKRLAVKPEDLSEKHLELIQRLNDIQSIDIDSIREKLKKDKENYFSSAKKLSKLRVKNAISFSNEINKILENLKMRKDSFSVNVEYIEKISSKGADKITFMIQSNAESERAPLVESASGGELSRVTLAVNTINASSLKIKRFHMFDEIDTGVSGETASYIGNLLRDMSKSYPVICITHIAHVAGMADNQLHVVKRDTKDKTVTTLDSLSEEDRKGVIATLLFGSKYTNEQLVQAEKLLVA